MTNVIVHSSYRVIRRCQPWRANSTEDAEATERCTQFGIGMFSEPVYGSGDWSELVKQTVPESFLPRLTKEEQEDIKGLAVPQSNVITG